MSSQAYWYLFPREPDINATLRQCHASILLRPYQLWHAKGESPEETTFLLSVEGEPIPAEWASPVTVSPAPTDLETQTFSIQKQDKSRQTLTATLVRKGPYLLASLGMEQDLNTRYSTEVAWALYDLPLSELQEVVSDHLALDNHDMRCTRTPQERAWLWCRKPEMFLLMKFSEREDIRIYHSFHRSPQVFTPLGWKGPLSPQLSQGEILFVLDQEGGAQKLETATWWAATELLQLRDIPQTQQTHALNQPPPVDVALRYVHAEPRDLPRLWLLEGEQGHEGIETLFFELGIEERRALSLAITELPDHDQPLFFLRDDRPSVQAPLFQHGQGVGFVSFLPEEGLYLRHGYRIYPSLPPDILRNAFRLQSHLYTLLQPEAEGSEHRLLRVAREAFHPIELYIRYQIGAHAKEAKRLAQQTTLDLLFDPQDLKPVAIMEDNAQPNREVLINEPPPPQPRTTPETVIDPLSLAPTRRGDGDNALQKLEQRLRERIRRGEQPSTQDWQELARLYYQEYIQKQNQLALQEALKALDQILYLDRSAPDAVKLERNILEETLRTAGLHFTAQMQSLDVHLQSKDPLRMRLAFRLRARMLLNDHERPEDQRMALRLHFYRDLATVEEHLMIREHYIYAEGIALSLQDDELYERARMRYRQALQNQTQLQQELPLVLLP